MKDGGDGGKLMEFMNANRWKTDGAKMEIGERCK